MSSVRVKFMERLFSDHVGIDFSSTHIRVMRLRPSRADMVPVAYGSFKWPEGVVEGGKIIDTTRAAAYLKHVKKSTGIRRAYASLPESVVTTELIILPSKAHSNIRHAVGAHLDAIGHNHATTMFDYRVIGRAPAGIAVQVFFVERMILDVYLGACATAGIAVIGIEPRHAALARAVTNKDEPYLVLVDVHDTDTAVSVLADGMPLMTGVMAFGGADLTDIIARIHGVDHDRARTLRDMHGITPKGEGAAAFQELGESLVAVEDMVKRASIYWHEQKTWHPDDANLGKFLLSGELSVVPGLADYLSATIGHNIVEANVWENCFSFDDVIPVITREAAAPYAAAIGLALAAKPSTISLLPPAAEHAIVHREHIRHTFLKAGMIVLSVVLAVALGAVCVLGYQFFTSHYASQNTASVVQ